jgi:hypothetical protein
VKSDGEGAVAKMEQDLNDQGILLSMASKNQHVAKVERKIRVIKERVRGIAATLPFHLTTQLTIFLVYFCVYCINLFPTASSVTVTSPRELFTGRKVDFTRDCRLDFGQYVQIAEPEIVTNTMKPRTSDAVALKPRGNAQGSYQFLSLHSWRVVSRDRWTVLPMPSSVIDRINAKAASDPASPIPDQPLGVTFRGVEPLTTSVDVLPSETTTDPGPQLREVIPQIPDDPLEPVEENPPATVIPAEDSLEVPPLGGDEELPAVAAEDNAHASDPPILPEPANVNFFPSEPTTEESIQEELQNFHRYDLRPRSLRHYNVFHTAADQKPNTFPANPKTVKEEPESLTAILKELQQMLSKSVWTPVHRQSLSPRQRKKIIRSKMFLKVKRSGTWKGRMVAGGHMQDRSLYQGFQSSPTVAIESIMLIAVQAAEEGRSVATVDFDGAYLNANMIEEVHMAINPYLSALIVELDPSYAEYLDESNILVVKLEKALYGCVESARLFFEHVKENMLKLGFTQNPLDKCVFNKGCSENCDRVSVGIHVDDLLISADKPELIDGLIRDLTKVYKKLTVNKGDVLDHLGMTFMFDRKSKTVKVDMSKYVRSILEENKTAGTVNTPAANHLFDISDDAEPLEKTKAESFHTTVAQLLYLCKRARPDIMTAVIFLTGRVLEPTVEDEKKLIRVLQYLNGTPELTLKLGVDESGTVKSYIDASFGVHKNKVSQAGTFITLGRGAIYAKAGKQGLNTKSSTEAELVGVSDLLGQAIWTKNFLKVQESKVNAVRLYQDNESTIALIRNGQSNSIGTRHIDIRYFFVKDRIESGEVQLEHMPTERMVADIFTKPLQGELFRRFRNAVLGMDDEV